MSPDRSAVVARIEAALADPVFFWEVLAALEDQSYRTVLEGWSDVRERHALERDDHGRYRLAAR